MGTLFEDDALKDLMDWTRENKKTASKIFALIKDIQRNGLLEGTGHPEALKYRKGYSRRIDHANRLVYDVDENNNLWILSCKGHYEE